MLGVKLINCAVECDVIKKMMAYHLLWFGLQLCCFLLPAEQPPGWYPPTLHRAPPQLSARRGHAHTTLLCPTEEWGTNKEEECESQLEREEKLWCVRWIFMFTFLTVEFGAATVAHVDIDASTVRGNLQEIVWTICKSRESLRLFFTSHW